MKKFNVELKALLSKVEQKLVKSVHEKPSKEALDRLAIFAGFQDWDSFRKQLHESPDDNASNTPKA